jgi:hypothetical protein
MFVVVFAGYFIAACCTLFSYIGIFCSFVFQWGEELYSVVCFTTYSDSNICKKFTVCIIVLTYSILKLSNDLRTVFER